MSVLVWIGQHRFWLLGIGVVALVAMAAAGVWLFVLHSPGTQVDLRQALRLYREDQKAGRSDGSQRLPPSGVYRYRTSGGEHLSFGGISRSFPATTEMIVTEAAGCATMRWEPLEQHMEGIVVCPRKDGSLGVTSVLSYEQIAGTETTSVIRCPAGTYFVPSDPVVGERWHTTCHSADQRVVVAGQVVGPSSVAVGGRKLPALHTRLTLTFSGAESGTNPNDYWVTVQDGLILRQRETVDVSQHAGPLGSVRYTEQMAIALRSVAPVTGLHSPGGSQP